MKLSLKSGLSRRALIALAALALLASVVAGREKPSIPVLEPAARIDTKIALPEDIDLEKLGRAASAAARTDPFASRGFGAKASAAQPSAPAQPSVPPLPFKYLGKMIDEGKLVVFVSRGEENYSLEAGQKIGEYRVDTVSEAEVRFTYLPLGTRQALAVN